jgi:hypothetical protein
VSPRTGSDRTRRTAIRLLRWYPRPWRVRYQREMQSLLADIPVDWKQVANLAVIGMREWLSPRALGWPARSAAGRLWWIRALTFVACWYALDGVARVVAARLNHAGVEITESMEVAAAMLGVAFAIRICLFGMLGSARRMSKSARAIRLQQRSWVNIRDGARPVGAADVAVDGVVPRRNTAGLSQSDQSPTPALYSFGADLCVGLDGILCVGPHAAFDAHPVVRHQAALEAGGVARALGFARVLQIAQ